MASEENFFRDYIILNPEAATLYDLLRIFYSSELEKRDFFDTPVPDRVRGFRRRWLIFISVLAQTIFLRLRTPMSKVGSEVELCLNLPDSNGGYRELLLNLLQGKVVKPDNSSATYRSIVGILDSRIDLDLNIKNSNNSSRYGAFLSMMASKLAYENKAFAQTAINHHWKMEFLEHYEFWNDYQEEYSTQAIMFQDTTTDPNLVFVAFRGTNPFDAENWRTDVDLSWYELESIGRIHSGFMKALGLQKITGWPKEIGPSQHPFAYYTIREKLRGILEKNKDARFILTGHSLGGALAILMAAVLIFHEEEEVLERVEGVYTFGQPRVGDEKFGEFMKEKLRVYEVKYFRYVYSNDLVPRLPYDDKTTMYRHFGSCLFYNSCYKGQVLEEEPNKNYFSVVWVIPKSLNAGWELMRSFIIPYVKGWDYREGWFLRFYRIIGLLFPGLSAHGPQDYVNLTTLGQPLTTTNNLKQD